MKKLTSLAKAHTSGKYLTACAKGRTWVDGKKTKLLPVIYLSGASIQDAGFAIGAIIVITCEPGKINLTVSTAKTCRAVGQLLQNGEVNLT
jgi:hypothetical protein